MGENMIAEQNVNRSMIIIFLIPHFSSPLAPAAQIAVRRRLDMLVVKTF
jgi:hypothetical protein